MEISISRKIGPSEHVQYFGSMKKLLDFHNWKWHDAKGRGALCPPKMMSLPNQEPQNSKPKLKPKDNFPFCLLPARLRRLLTGVAFRLDECPRNVISCNISWRHPACQVRDIFFHWCENLQNGILSSLRAQELGFLAQKGPNLVQNMYFWSFWAKYCHFLHILSNARPKNNVNKVPRWVFRYVGNKTFDFSSKKKDFSQKRPNLAQNWHFCPLLAHLVPCWWIGLWLWRGLYLVLARHLFTLFIWAMPTQNQHISKGASLITKLDWKNLKEISFLGQMNGHTCEHVWEEEIVRLVRLSRRVCHLGWVS